MIQISPRFQRSATTLAVSIALITAGLTLSGCDSGPQMGRVSGKITYKDQPVPKGTVTLIPVDPKGRNATGNIMSDGTYAVQTENPNDGALVGEYLVAITSRDEELLDYIPKKRTAPKRHIPEKYESPQSSGLKATVNPGSNTINFTLTD